MTLRPELLPAPHRPTNLIAASLGLGLAGAIVAIATSARPVPAASAPTPPTITIEEPVVHVAEVARMPEPPEPSVDFAFAFRAGGSLYIKLADIAAADDGTKVLPAHGKLKLADDDGVTSAIATVADRDMPDSYRVLRDHALFVDGTCTATVADFALVSRLLGDTAYAGIERSTWTTKAVTDRGQSMLAARLVGCETGTFARSTSLPPSVVLERVKDGDLVRAARSALLSSDLARETQRAWATDQGEGNWYDTVELATQVLRHPRTGVTWVAIHGNYWEGCGGPTVNVWGLYRVDADGALETVSVRTLGAIHEVEKIVDVDGDGDLEVIGRPWLGLGMALEDAAGGQQDAMEIPFFGCPC